MTKSCTNVCLSRNLQLERITFIAFTHKMVCAYIWFYHTVFNSIFIYEKKHFTEHGVDEFWRKKKESLIHKSTFQNENKTCKKIAVTLQLQYIHCTHETVNTKGNAGIKFS